MVLLRRALALQLGLLLGLSLPLLQQDLAMRHKLSQKWQQRALLPTTVGQAALTVLHQLLLGLPRQRQQRLRLATALTAPNCWRTHSQHTVCGSSWHPPNLPLVPPLVPVQHLPLLTVGRMLDGVCLGKDALEA